MVQPSSPGYKGHVVPNHLEEMGKFGESVSLGDLDVRIGLRSRMLRDVQNKSTSLCYLLGLAVIIHSAFPVLTFLKVTKKKIAWSVQDIMYPAAQVGLCTLYYFLLEFLLHYFYSSALAYYPDLVTEMDDPSLLGLGICLTVLFFLKYRILYGLGSAVAGLEGMLLPPPPKCVSRIHLCSYLWRHFDRGLYLWIQRYIYRPIVANGWTPRRRMMGAAASFAFVCSWHGMDSAVVVWCTLNFVGISTELLMEVIRNRNSWKKIEGTFFGGMRLQFLRAAVSAPHFLFSMFSCMFFLSNVDIGLVFFRRIICVSSPISDFCCVCIVTLVEELGTCPGHLPTARDLVHKEFRSSKHPFTVPAATYKARAQSSVLERKT
ncbi:hypothetical protein HPB51_013161 [Rhipicephalus microplus]|uniref:Acyltransferase required for palmitoylation of hedgehog hh family of secreted signaling n=1 Tax=Rhipicephalus microplus TaxID=6941 RepID=A0A9J6E1H9_RHIMP|nr:hypothetical protein HPB51_013161 [Rhipicephalus microplus]